MSISLKTRKTLFPGQPGTKKLVREYGEKLMCVRYRYDTIRKERVTTVEVIIDRSGWEPNSERIPPNKRIPIRVRLGEKELGKRVRAAGGRWNRKRRVWEVAHKDVIALGLTDRIVSEEM